MNYLLPLAGLAVLSGCAGTKKAEQKKPLNIVYIMSDDHAYQMMSCYNPNHIQTPNLDRIAREGVRFTNSFVCNSISGPSRAVLLTGKHSHKNGYTDNAQGASFDGNQQTVQQLYRDKEKWNRMSLMNIANAGIFSADRSIMEYARDIWGAAPVK